jgi:hypothetical protein
MLQPGNDVHLAPESLPRSREKEHFRPEDLERDRPAKCFLFRQKDDSHSPASEPLLQRELTESRGEGLVVRVARLCQQTDGCKSLQVAPDVLLVAGMLAAHGIHCAPPLAWDAFDALGDPGLAWVCSGRCSRNRRIRFWI